ncbi:dienelactone hydrolase family protein [uncultured Pelagibacterium sp.]|uniref:dienelactone hydrolase family protein n=1 Tax=uncultured Pelagibacterium sp. TaxID=1159875 RepID=UPI0030DA61CB|tara:strand:- start:4161 stop:4721 length:561 start_codon:yes stop_codon:yes gene_type:complete
MAHVVLFHSILGLRPVEGEIAAVFEADGHTVTLPDLFDGQSADNYDAAFALRKEVGTDAIMERARAAVEAAPPEAVLSGVSFGASLIGEFWADRPQMAGALLFAGITDWMDPPTPGLPVSVHIARPDPFDDEDYFADWVAQKGEADLQMHRYDGAGHYFLDPSLDDYNEAAAKLCLDRSREFLKGL